MPETPESPFGPLIETRLRLMTWNIWWRFGPWEERLAAIRRTISRVAPDLVALQEVWAEGSAGQVDLIADPLGFDRVYDARLDVDGIRFGVAIASRWPIAGSESRPLPGRDDRDEPRTVLRADIDGPRGPIQMFTTHLNWRFDESHVRQEQVRTVAGFIADSPERAYPALLCGDFNAEPDSDEIGMLTGKTTGPSPPLVFHDAWRVAGNGPGHTWTNENPYAALDLEPDRRIDYVFAGWPKAGGAGHVVRAELAGGPVDGVWPSDHLAVVVELRY